MASVGLEPKYGGLLHQWDPGVKPPKAADILKQVAVHFDLPWHEMRKMNDILKLTLNPINVVKKKLS